MTKFLLISGSPRNGNTDFILKKIFDSIKGEKELIFLRDKNIKHCQGCLACSKTNKCVIDDDMTEIREKMLNSDIIIIGTPNYFDNVSGLLKNFVDRTHPFYKAESLKDKKLILIMVGGGEIEGSQKYLDCTMYGFIKYLKFDLVGSYCFKALNLHEVEKNQDSLKLIDEIIKKVNSL